MTALTVIIPNFTREELECRCCGKLNMDTEFIVRLQAFRYLLKKPLTVTCASRCKKHNKEVGGENTSCHICEGKKSTAADVTNSNCAEIYNLATKSGLFNEIIYYKAKNFVHLGLDRNQKGNYFVMK
jgi:hypothetical protein